MTITTIVLLLLATLTMIVVGIGVLLGERERRRTMRFVIAESGQSRLRRLRRSVEQRVTHTPLGRRLRRQLDRADVPWPVADTLLGYGALLAVALITAYRVGGPILTVLAAGLLYIGTRTLVSYREERRFARFVDQLPDLARLLANAASAGLSLRAALAVAAQESQEPTRGELEKVNEELALGVTIDEALTRMGDRLPSRELAVLVNTLVIQSRSGGRIVTALTSITEALEIRRDLRREVNTLMAGSKATVIAVAFLGAMMVWLVHSTLEGGLRGLLATPLGVVVFVVSLALFSFGMILIRRATKVEI